MVIAREGIRARMDGKILGTPVILTFACLISIIFLKAEVLNLR